MDCLDADGLTFADRMPKVLSSLVDLVAIAVSWIFTIYDVQVVARNVHLGAVCAKDV